jgi:hypothetical protein
MPAMEQAMITHLYTFDIQLASSFTWFRAPYFRPTFAMAASEATREADYMLRYHKTSVPLRIVQVAIEDVPEHHAKIWRNWTPDTSN